MPLSAAVNEIACTVEKLSGRPVHIQEDASLTAMATVVTARGSAPAHFVRYRPGTRSVDYLIAFQLGFLVRLFSCPPDNRFQVVASQSERDLGIKSMGLDFDRDFADALFGNIIIQMRTFPIGMRVDEWIVAKYPELREEQERAARTQLSEHEQALSPEIRNRFPKAILDANSRMNAAFAAFWARRFGDKRYTVPYTALGYDAAADSLLATLSTVDAAPTHDRRLIAQWAATLGLDQFFHFEQHTLS